MRYWRRPGIVARWIRLGRCLGDNKRRANWVVCAIGLANRLLSADIEAMPIERRPNELPAWLLSNVTVPMEQTISADHLPIIPPPLMLDNSEFTACVLHWSTTALA